ncbi:myeloid-derived growth factor [Orycteropus afer afer]|uniref:Myeloid-derived growth factor n=1 Tax=Orycteropus afer afer TaxID=1230840 RepID=A0A8B7AMR4_ORYAF|nr:myeloid-derived growth factor [Orycteropus afer afer]
MAAPSRRRNSGSVANLWSALLLAAVALRPVEAASEPTTVAFDVRPGGVVHSFSQSVGPGDKYTCMFTYASQGGTNEPLQPQGKSYLYFTQFKAEVQGAEIEYGMAYSKAAFERESDVPLKNEEFEVTKTAGMYRWPLKGALVVQQLVLGSYQKADSSDSPAAPPDTDRGSSLVRCADAAP